MPGSETPPRGLILLMAVATGALVANLYYSQPLIGVIAPQLQIGAQMAGALVGVTQIGYGVGLFFLVSLADLVESKRLVLISLAGLVAGLAALASASNGAVFLTASFVVGLCSSGAQILVPYASHMAAPDRRGRTVGLVMSGLLTGIMLARPFALFVAASLGWRAVFWISAGLMVALGLALAARMTPYRPPAGLPYRQVLGSMVKLMRTSAPLRRRTAYQALMFAAFNLFWTAAPLMLATRFHLSQQAIGLFALAGAGGALAAPLAGWLGDRGWVRGATGAAMAVLALSFAGTVWAVAAGALAALVLLTVALDGAVQLNQVVGQKVIFGLDPAARGRINAIYMTVVFVGGAAGSTVSTAAFHGGGWAATAWIGAGLGAVMLALLGLELISTRKAA